MSRLDDLPPDQRAALSLLLGQRKTYAEVAALLGIAERAVHDRAHAALTVLAPALARDVPGEQRAAIGDYLLDQPAGGVAGRLQTRNLLAASDAARAWATAVSDELAPLGDPVEIPAPAAAPTAPAAASPPPASAPAAPPAASSAAPSAPARASSAPASAASAASSSPRAPVLSPASGPSSRTGGAILLGLLAAGVIVGILFATGVLGGGGSSHHAKTAAKTPSGPTVNARLALTAPNGSKTSAGLVQLLSEGSKRAFYAVAEGLAPTHGFFYALWLYNSPTSSLALGKAPAVGSNKRLEGGGLLPANAAEFKEILLTRETSTSASRPGPVVLHGRFSLTG